MTNQLTTIETFHVIANSTNGGHWQRTGRVDFTGTFAECETHLLQWESADTDAVAIGFDAASCDTRFIVSDNDLTDTDL